MALERTLHFTSNIICYVRLIDKQAHSVLQLHCSYQISSDLLAIGASYTCMINMLDIDKTNSNIYFSENGKHV